MNLFSDEIYLRSDQKRICFMQFHFAPVRRLSLDQNLTSGCVMAGKLQLF
jgi:hypothetical protein